MISFVCRSIDIAALPKIAGSAGAEEVAEAAAGAAAAAPGALALISRTKSIENIAAVFFMFNFITPFVRLIGYKKVIIVI